MVVAGLAAAGLSVTHASLTGVGARRPELRLTVHAAAGVRELRVSVPRGFSLSEPRLGGGLSVRAGDGRSLPGQATVVGRALLVTLRQPSAGVRLVVSSPVLSVSRREARLVRQHQVCHVTFGVAVTRANGTTDGRKLRFALEGRDSR